MNEDELEIVVEEIMGKKQVAVSGSHHLGETQKLRKLIEEYESLILELNEISENKDGLDMIWESGKVITDKVGGDEKKKLDDVLKYCPDIEYTNTRSLYRWIYFYQLFPEKGYRCDFSWSIYTEFCSAKPDDETRDIYDDVAQLDEEPPSFSIRTWRKFRNKDNPEKEDVIRYSVKNASNSILKNEDSDIKNGIRTAFDLLNIEGKIDNETFEGAVSEFKD